MDYIIIVFPALESMQTNLSAIVLADVSNTQCLPPAENFKLIPCILIDFPSPELFPFGVGAGDLSGPRGDDSASN